MTLLDQSSIYEAFCSTATRWPQRDCLQTLPGTAAAYGIAPGTLSYGDALAQVNELANAYASAGYQRGMRVALLFENRPAFFIHWLALNSLGGSVVPINPDLQASELEYLIGHAEPALVVALASRQKQLIDAAQSAGLAVPVITPDAVLMPPRENAIVTELHEGLEQEAAVLYTSGTTGKPKGCVLANAYFLLAGHWYRNVGGLASLSDTGERMITPLPIFHMNAMAYSFMAMVSVGGCLIPLDRFHPRSWWQDVIDSGATCLHYLGVMPSMLMGAEPSDADAAHQVRFGFGAGVDPRLQASFEERFGFPLVEAWAMTETGAGAVVAASTSDRRIGEACLGRAAQDVACRIVDEAGADVPPDQPGELLVRRAQGDPRFGFFSHYYKDAQATEQAWCDGWFRTGDLVRQNDQGELFFVDRKKNLIRRSGENIAAVEVESVLMRHPSVQMAAVTSVPDPLRGDEVFACLQVDQPSASLTADIMQWCLSQMAYYKAPGFIAYRRPAALDCDQKNSACRAEGAGISAARTSRYQQDSASEKAPSGERDVMRRKSYSGVVVTAPCTIAYERYSIESAHWWIAKALRGTLDAAALKPLEIDGLTVSSFTLFPDTAVG